MGLVKNGDNDSDSGGDDGGGVVDGNKMTRPDWGTLYQVMWCRLISHCRPTVVSVRSRAGLTKISILQYFLMELSQNTEILVPNQTYFENAIFNNSSGAQS